MASIDADELLPNDHVKKAVAAGQMTQLHRGHAYAEEGDTFEIDGDVFEVTSVDERTLGDLTDEDARAEGSPDLDAYKERMKKVHGGNFEWDPTSDVVRHRFERRSE
ncbi:MAG: ASCH domain-containing protein [Natronomonas sp.]